MSSSGSGTGPQQAQSSGSASSAMGQEAGSNLLVKALLHILAEGGDGRVTASALTEILGLKAERSVWRKLNTMIEPYGYKFNRGSLELLPAPTGVEGVPDGDAGENQEEDKGKYADDNNKDENEEGVEKNTENATEEFGNDSNDGEETAAGKKRNIEEAGLSEPEEEREDEIN